MKKLDTLLAEVRIGDRVELLLEKHRYIGYVAHKGKDDIFFRSMDKYGYPGHTLYLADSTFEGEKVRGYNKLYLRNNAPHRDVAAPMVEHLSYEKAFNLSSLGTDPLIEERRQRQEKEELEEWRKEARKDPWEKDDEHKW